MIWKVIRIQPKGCETPIKVLAEHDHAVNMAEVLAEPNVQWLYLRHQTGELLMPVAEVSFITIQDN